MPSTPRVASRVLAHVVLLLGLALQTVLLYMPASGEGGLPPGTDKVGHALMFGLPAALAWWLGYRWAPLALCWYAPVSELIQGSHLVHRDPDLHDVVADITGIILLCGLIVVSRRRGIR